MSAMRLVNQPAIRHDSVCLQRAAMPNPVIALERDQASASSTKRWSILYRLVVELRHRLYRTTFGSFPATCSASAVSANSQGRCEHDLNRDPEAEVWLSYCPNTSIFRALR